MYYLRCAVDKRYATQIRLAEIGETGQHKLSQSSVLCIGGGGLAATVLPLLVAAGVGKITIMDNDEIAESNLNRQTLFLPSEIGLAKVSQLVEKLTRQNPTIQINAIKQNLNTDNALQLIQEHDLVIDCCDDYPTKLLINDTCVSQNKPWVYASVLGWDGQVVLFDNKSAESPCLRCYSMNAPLGNSCTNNGVLGASVAIIGSFQATLAIQALLGKFENANKIRVFDLWALQLQEFTIPIKQNCTHRQNHELSYDDYRIDDYHHLNSNFRLIDIRTLREWEDGHLPHAIHVNIGSLINAPHEYLPANSATLIYCHQQQLSKIAVATLRQQGFNVWWLQGGYQAYKKKQG